MHFDCGHLSATGAKVLFSPRRGLTRPLSIRSETYSPSVSLAFDSSLYTREPLQYHSTKVIPRPRLPRQSSAAALCRAQPPKAALSAEQCALPRNDKNNVIANQ